MPNTQTQIRQAIVSLLAFATQIAAKSCFEGPGSYLADHGISADYSLDCLNAGDEAIIFKAIMSKCSGVFQTGGDDCANSYTASTGRCHGLFGSGSTCTLSYHVLTTPDQCMIDIMGKDCHKEFGTTTDYIAIISMGVAALCIIGCLLRCCVGYINKLEKAERSDAGSDAADIEAQTKQLLSN